ncbi:porin family protein [Marinobacter sp. JSM 1782161]|uniref:porin family protein n=1 Tax=Marinobacter sp. JSM 1782161 TaxID=2685906 RepID=UPI0014025073|nr:porin family protein [Marinobacter sp. JSM 1782161]
MRSQRRIYAGVVGLKASLYALLFLLCSMSPASVQALGDDTFTLSVGGSISRFDSDITVNGETRDNNASIDIENDLGQEDDVDFVSVRALWRFAERHRLSVEYSPFSRESSTVLDRDFEFEDTVINAGANVTTDSRFYIYDVNYIYSLYKSQSMEVGVSAGVYWVDLDFDVQASGVISDSDGSAEFQNNYRDSVSSDMPLPLFGLYFDHEFAPGWQLRAAGRYFEADIDDYDGRITSMLVGVEYNVWKPLSIGVSATHFDLDVGADKDRFRGEFGWRYSGGQLYLKTQF